MAKESDMGIVTTGVAATDYDFDFNEIFSSVPICITMSMEEKKKSACFNIDSTGATVHSESGFNLWYLAREAGYDAGSATTNPESDAGSHTISVAKALEAETFNSTFGAAPVVVTGCNEEDVADKKGDKNSAANITTTGFDICMEATGDCGWIAVKAGFFDGV